MENSLIIEPRSQVETQAVKTLHSSQTTSLPVSIETALTVIQRIFYELLTVIVSARNLSAWHWHLCHSKSRQIIPLFTNLVCKSSHISTAQKSNLRELKQLVADFSFPNESENQRLSNLQIEFDQLQKQGYCYGASVNLLIHELKNKKKSYPCSALLNDLSNSQNRTVFYEEVEFIRAKIEEALYQNQEREDLSIRLRKLLQYQKNILLPFKTIGEAEKGNYLNFEEISKAIKSLSSQKALIIHGESEKRSHALAIIQNTHRERFYFYDWADIPFCNGRMYAFGSSSELQQAFISYLSSHYSDLADSTSKWRLQQIDL